jgi:hypothetical protein
MSGSKSGDWYCILDALAECDEGERKQPPDSTSESFSADSKVGSAKGHEPEASYQKASMQVGQAQDKERYDYTFHR